MNNKGSDKNVGSIEEDIRILENLKSYLNLLVYEGKDKIIYNDLLWDEKTVDCINAIEHLINNYTRQKQINEEYQKINGELREKVKELEEKNKHLSNTSDYETISLECTNLEEQLEIANNRIQELEEQVKTLDEAYTGVIKESKKWFDIAHNSIPKQVVIDKMEELNKEIKSCDEIDAIFKIKQQQILQELLEGEKNEF